MAKQMCGVCCIVAAKYKCPKCRFPYCSVACNKTHQETNCQIQPAVVPTSSIDVPVTPPPPPPPSQTQPAALSPVVLDATKLALLDESVSLREQLGDPVLQQILSTIDNSSNPTDALQTALRENENFAKVADLILTITGAS